MKYTKSLAIIATLGAVAITGCTPTKEAQLAQAIYTPSLMQEEEFILEHAPEDYHFHFGNDPTRMIQKQWITVEADQIQRTNMYTLFHMDHKNEKGFLFIGCEPHDGYDAAYTCDIDENDNHHCQSIQMNEVFLSDTYDNVVYLSAEFLRRDMGLPKFRDITTLSQKVVDAQVQMRIKEGI